MTALDAALARLSGIGWFSEIEERFRKLLAQDARLISREPGETVFHYGDPGAGLFGISEGSVMLSFPRDDGVVVPVATLGVGYWLGDLAALSGRPGLVSIEARSRLTAVNIPARSVRAIVESTPDIYRAFYLLNTKNQALSLRLLAGQTAETTERRILLRLQVLSDYAQYDGGWIDTTHGDLADQLGVSLPTIQRGLKKLETNGNIEVGYARIRVVKPLGG